MFFEDGGLLYEVKATNSSQEEKTVDFEMDIPGSEIAGSPVRAIAYQSNDPKLTASNGFGDATESKASAAKLEMVHAFVELPDSLKTQDTQVAAAWKKTLKPGESVKLHLVMVHAWNAKKFPSPELVEKALELGQAIHADLGRREIELGPPMEANVHAGQQSLLGTSSRFSTRATKN